MSDGDRREPSDERLPDYGDSGRDPEDLVATTDEAAGDDDADSPDEGDESPGDAPDVEQGFEPMAPATHDELTDPAGPSG